MPLKELVEELDTQMNELYSRYIQLHEQLRPYLGRQLNGDAEIEEVNTILHGIQHTFAQMFPAYNFIAYRYESTQNAVNAYDQFIKSIKASGAKQQEDVVNG